MGRIVDTNGTHYEEGTPEVILFNALKERLTNIEDFLQHPEWCSEELTAEYMLAYREEANSFKDKLFTFMKNTEAIKIKHRRNKL